MSLPQSETGEWTPICDLSHLLPERGVAALVAGDAVAVFRTHDDVLHAIGNIDPFTGASVLSRGIVGDRAGAPTVASPIYKQVFDLRSGVCLDDPEVRVTVYPVRLRDETVEVGSP